jgi:hypothetical protein
MRVPVTVSSFHPWPRWHGAGVVDQEVGAVQNDPDDFLLDWTAVKGDSIYVLSYH